MVRIRCGYLTCLVVLLAVSCKEPFIPEIEYGQDSFLVVEGSINVGQGSTTMKLSKTIPLGQPFSPLAVTGAVVTVEGEDERKYPLSEQGNGSYRADLDLPGSMSYRIRILLANGREYVSDLTAPVQTPSIDSLTWKYDDTGVAILFNSHGEENSTGYYQFEYEETWELRSFYFSLLTYENRQLSYRPEESIQSLYRCWKSSASPDITIYSTGNQMSDIIKDYHVTFIPINSERLSQRYSILVKQRVLSHEGYEYLRLMKKNTGPLGSFSDPQPAALRGNIRCTTSDEPVVGFIGTYKTQEIRMFINRWDVPDWNYELYCTRKRMPNNPDTLAKWLTSGSELPTEPASVLPGGEIVDLYRSRNICVDCHKSGGNNVKPPFWD